MDLSRLCPSHLKVMKLLWDHGDLTASQLAAMLKDQTNWQRNTSYTVVRDCVNRGYIERIEPRFMCHALVTLEQMRAYSRKSLVDTLYGGDARALIDDLKQDP